MCSAGGGTAEIEGTRRKSISVTEEHRGRMCIDEGKRHQHEDSGQERKGTDGIGT